MKVIIWIFFSNIITRNRKLNYIAYESDRAESGRKEIVKGMKYTLQKYQTAHDREIIDDMLMNFTGYTLETLVEKSVGYDYSQYDELEDFD